MNSKRVVVAVAVAVVAAAVIVLVKKRGLVAPAVETRVVDAVETGGGLALLGASLRLLHTRPVETGVWQTASRAALLQSTAETAAAAAGAAAAGAAGAGIAGAGAVAAVDVPGSATAAWSQQWKSRGGY